MADNFCGSAEIPLSVMTWPRKVMELFVNLHFGTLTSIYWNNDGIQNGQVMKLIFIIKISWKLL